MSPHAPRKPGARNECNARALPGLRRPVQLWRGGGGIAQRGGGVRVRGEPEEGAEGVIHKGIRGEAGTRGRGQGGGVHLADPPPRPSRAPTQTQNKFLWGNSKFLGNPCTARYF